MVLFKEEGGFNTEEGLFIAASGVFSQVSFESQPGENLFFWASGVLTVGIVIGLGELFWRNPSSVEFELLPGTTFGSSSIKSSLHSSLGIAITLLRMADGDLFVLEQ